MTYQLPWIESYAAYTCRAHLKEVEYKIYRRVSNTLDYEPETALVRADHRHVLTVAMLPFVNVLQERQP